MDATERRCRIVKLVSWGLYAMALAVFGLGILGGLSVANASAAIPAATIGFQSPAFKPLWDELVLWLNIAGGLVVAGSLLMGLTFAAVGLLLTRALTLEQRVHQLESTLATGA